MKAKLFILVILAVFMLITQCKKEEEATGVDKELFDEANASLGFTYYKGNTALLASSQPAHEAYMRVRFNMVAQSVLDSTGKLPVGSSFPNGSLIVKELYESESGPLVLFAIMKKDSSSSNAGANWLWAEIKPDEKVVISVTKKGASCTSCHGMSTRDYARIFDLF